jgi:hypothetical protein
MVLNQVIFYGGALLVGIVAGTLTHSAVDWVLRRRHRGARGGGDIVRCA